MRCAAADDEKTESPEETLIWKGRTGSTDEKREGTGDDDVRNADDQVCENVGPNEPGVADVAIPVRQEIRRKNKTRKEPKESCGEAKRKQNNPCKARRRL